MAGLKAKTIKSILSKKINTWLDTIEDESLKATLQKSVIVTGGCIVSMLQGEEVNDFDIYLRDYSTVKRTAEYYVSKFKEKCGKQDFNLFVDDSLPGRIRITAQSSGVATENSNKVPYQYFETLPDEKTQEYVQKVLDNPEEIEDVHEDTSIEIKKNKGSGIYRPVFLTSNAITLSDKIQIVLRFYGEPDEIRENYDFSHCTSYWTNWNNELVLRPQALESILSKELRYVGSRYPICSLVRLRKFIARGWRINAGQILKMSMQISELDLTDINTLEDQLTGVDTAYFVQLISSLREKDPEKVNVAYLTEIVNRLF